MIWLIGDKGMLGTELALTLARAGIEHVGSDREVSILDPSALASFARGSRIEWIVNCAAYTAVDRAEDEPEANFRINAEGPGNIARLARSIGARMLHVSTDYVFGGGGTRPFREDDPVAPACAYGRAKAEGEERVRSACPESVILRTAWLYGEHGANFVFTMLRLMRSKDRIGVVADQRGAPTWSVDLASAIALVASSRSPRFGNYHYTDGGEATWHEFALEIRRLGREAGILERDCAVEALATGQYPTKARRPAYSVLSTEAIVRDYGVEVPDWRASLGRFIAGRASAIRDATEPGK